MTAYPQEYTPDTRRENLLHTAGVLVLVVVVFPVFLVEQAARTAFARIQRR